MSTNRIKQGVAKIVYKNYAGETRHRWIRISRAYLTSLQNYWTNQPEFFYMKIYEFDRITRQVGRQLAYINLNKAVML